MAAMPDPVPRFLYVASCYSASDASAYHLLVTSDEEHDPLTDAGSAAIVRLLAQVSERRDWFTTDDAYREEVRRTDTRIGDEIHELLRYPAVRHRGRHRCLDPRSHRRQHLGRRPARNGGVTR